MFQIEVSSCDTMECENESTCVEEDGAAVCVCPPGATGERCELRKHSDLTIKGQIET